MQYTDKQIQENRDIWVAALKSGDYKKGVGVLRSKDDNYCCLGVACQLFDNDKVELNSTGNYMFGDERLIVTATYRAINALGLYNSSGNGSDYSPVVSLAEINDDNDSFTPVIEAIETGQYWKPLTDV